jgi:hypothetical protein
VAVPKEQITETENALRQLSDSLAKQPPSEKQRERLAELNDQMGAVAIDLAEAQARLKTLDAKCREMRELLAKADDYELQIGMQLPLIKSAYERAWQNVQELRIRLANLRHPSVTVIGG